MARGEIILHTTLLLSHSAPSGCALVLPRPDLVMGGISWFFSAVAST